MPSKRDQIAVNIAESLLESPNPPTGANLPSSLETAAAAAQPWALSPHEVLGSMALVGEPVPTGAPWFDRNMRHNGIPPGKLIGIGGPPQSGKSQIFAQFAYDISPTFPVYALMADAGWQDMTVALAALCGYDKAAVEKDPLTYSTKLGEALGERSLLLVNPEHPQATLTAFLDWVASRQDPTPVVFVDSAQVIRHGLDKSTVGERSHAEVVGSLCRAFSIRHKAVTFLSTKANRAFYRNRDKADNATAIASAMGGDYEYTFDSFAVLSRPDKDTGLVGLEWAKNRLGNAFPSDTTLRWDHHISRLVEADDAQIEALTSTKKVEKHQPIRLRILETIRGMQPLSKNAIAELVTGDRNTVLRCIGELAKDKKLITIPTPSGRGLLYKEAYGDDPIPPA